MMTPILMTDCPLSKQHCTQVIGPSVSSDPDVTSKSHTDFRAGPSSSQARTSRSRTDSHTGPSCIS